MAIPTVKISNGRIHIEMPWPNSHVLDHERPFTRLAEYGGQWGAEAIEAINADGDTKTLHTQIDGQRVKLRLRLGISCETPGFVKKSKEQVEEEKRVAILRQKREEELAEQRRREEEKYTTLQRDVVHAIGGHIIFTAGSKVETSTLNALLATANAIYRPLSAVLASEQVNAATSKAMSIEADRLGIADEEVFANE